MVMGKKEMIMTAALDIFAEKGYHATKMEEIAEAAGLGKGTLYGYFSSKQDLFDSMVFWYLDQYFQSLEKDVDPEGPVADTLRTVIRNHIQILQRTRSSFMKILMDFSNMPRSQEEILFFHREFLAGKVAAYSRMFERAAARGELRNVSPVLCASFLMGALKGISENFLVNEEGAGMPAPEKLVEEITDFLCHGMKK